MKELVWLQELMRKHVAGVRLVSVSFDKKKADSLKAIRHSVTRDPAIIRLRAMGVTAGGGDVERSMIDALRKQGVVIEPASVAAVLKTARLLGADLERVALAEREPLKAAFGDHAELYLVPPDDQTRFWEAVGYSGLPYLIVLDRKGVLRFAGYPDEDSVTELVDTLVAADKSNKSTLP